MDLLLVMENKWINYMPSQTSGDRLGYNIYQDAGLTKNIWQCLYTKCELVSKWKFSFQFIRQETGEEQITTMYGAMSGGQYVTPGNYSVNVGVGIYF